MLACHLLLGIFSVSPSTQPPLDAMSLMRLTELLAAAEATQESQASSTDRVASPPLSMREFYEQQKLWLKK